MTNVDAAGSGPEEGSPAAAALEHIVDPVVAVSDGTFTYANGAARDAFEIDDLEDCDPATAIDAWTALAAAIDETTVGTVRQVPLEGNGERCVARVHRDDGGATVVFESADSASDDDSIEVDRDGTAPATTDRAVKERALEEAPVGITISDPDREDNPLVYVNEAYQEITGYDYDEVVGRNCRFLQGEDTDPEPIAEMREAIDEDRPVTVELKNYRKDGTEFWNEVTIAPVRSDAGEITNYVGFQNDVTARKEAELALERRTDELEYILERVEGLVQDVTAAVAGSTDRAALEDAVCDRIAAESAYEGVWIGERNPATGTTEVRTSAGETPAAESIPLSGDAAHPAAEALTTADIALATDDGATTAAFPLFYNEIEYGVLVVRSTPEHDVDDRETVILSALARAIASGINARETSRMLATDAVVAVELELTDRAVAPVALSADADCRLEYRRSVHQSGDAGSHAGAGETAALFTATGASADELTAAAADIPGVDCRIVVERDEADECLIELAGADDPVGWLSERGVRTREIESEDGRARFTLEIPRSANVRSIVEAVEDRYEGTDVRSVRQRDREGETRQEFAARLEAELTERQLAALQRAYLGGYFEWPRPTTGEELAQSMNVSRPTFHEHLRSAEAKLCRAFFDE